MNNAILDRPIAFHRAFVSITGSVTGALLLSQAIYWQKRSSSEDGWFWKTQRDWEEETGMTRREFDTARKACVKFLLSERRGVPARLFFKVDESAVQTSLAESAKLDCPKTPNRLGVNRQTTNTETTSETTTKKNAAAAADSRVEEFQKLWEQSYKANTQRKYIFTDKDVAALKKFFKLSEMTAKELADLAWKAWQCSGPKFFYCKQSKSLTWFCDKFNSIVAELDAGGVTTSSQPGEEEDQTLYHPPGWKPA